jgi:A/G-specific adenine glycosylase
MTNVEKSKAQKLIPLLLDWFSKNARDLPWRRTRDPYAIWVSEIMLQQTQVKTVIPFWERWLRVLPTIEAAARAPSAKIHKLWEGLGYYTRVRNLQKAAQQIVAQQTSRRRRGDESQTGNKLETPHVVSYKFPEEFDDVLALPGIGRYTAGAICSIAFNQPVPILDGNVIRVLTRIFGITENPKEKKANAKLWQLAEQLVMGANHWWGETPGEPALAWQSIPATAREDARPTLRLRANNSCSYLNQSLMELGALVCTPRNTQCEICPVKKLCVAFKENRVETLPNLGKRETTTARYFIAFVIERNNRFLVRQRPAGVVNGHLWEFPNVETGATAGRARHSVRAAAQLFENGAQRTDAPYQINDLQDAAIKPLCSVKHSITRYRITLEAFRVHLGGTSSTTITGVWKTPAQMQALAFTSAHKKILGSLVKRC